MHRVSSRYLAALLLLGCLSSSCDPDDPPSPSNNPPTLTGPTASPADVLSGATVALALEATDPDGDPLTFAWSQTPAAPAGSFSGTATSSPSWTAPAVTVDTSFQLNVTVRDSRGATARGSVTVRVRVPPPANRAPTITAGPAASPSSVTGSAPVALSVTGSDPDGDALTYAWTQEPATPAGTFSSTTTASPTWTSPVVASTQRFTLRVTISDGRGGSVQGQVVVNVEPPPPVNNPPTLTAGPSASPSSVAGGQPVMLSVTASDAEGDPLTYAWSQSPASPAGAFSNTSVASPTWTSPTVTADTTIQLVVTVTDGNGGTTSGSVTVTVLAPRNQNPTITAGPTASPTSVTGSAPVTLSVTASDPDGDTLTYAWTQEPAMPAGTFSSTTTANPIWTSPELTSAQRFTLRVTISDGKGGSVQGQVVVDVAPPPPANNPPTLTAGPTSSAPSVAGGMSVTLSVTATDPDGDTLTYTWSQSPATPAGAFSNTSVVNPTWTSPTVTADTPIQLVVMVSDGRGGMASGSVTVTVLAPPNRDPTITAGPTASPGSVTGSAPVALSVTATDPDGDTLTYAWVQEPASPAGTFSSTTAADPTWTSPVVAATQRFTLRVMISDGRGGSVEGQVVVNVDPPPPVNNPPTLTGPTATPSTVDSLASASLTVTATDPDGDPLTYAWTQEPATPAGTFSDTSAVSPTWTAPRVTTETLFQLRVTVSDGRGGMANAAAPVTVRAYVNRPPVLTGPTASVTTVDEQLPIDLFSRATDPDGDPVTYAWTQVTPASPMGAFSSTTDANPTWTAPDVNATGVFRLRVTASDGQGGNTPGNIDITVNKVNRAPNVAATISGPTTLAAGTIGTFSITASDPDGDPLTYSWAQIVGSPGTFVGGIITNSSAQWYSPVVSTATSFTLSVSVTDGQSPAVVRTLTLPVTVPRYSTDVQAVWNARCTGCHGGSGGLSLANPSYANLVNVNANACAPRKRVLPGDPDNSALIQKMEGTACGSRMPAGDPSYYDNNRHLLVRVRSWILAGAAND
jgi:hypothetical protein